MLNNFKNYSNETRFLDLINAVQYCSLCQRLNDRKKILSTKNGNIESKVLFVAEAPGRLGADITGIPLYGDKTGDNFNMLLSNIGWNREDIFITNALLCNPRDPEGNNSTPTRNELNNCSLYLEMVINLIKPEIIVTLGITALKALAFIAPHNIILKNDVGKISSWYNKKIIPLYHPGPRAVLHRSIIKQRADFIELAKHVHPLRGLLQKKTIKNKTNAFEKESIMQIIIIEILRIVKTISYFRLTKLLYLIDLETLNKLGYCATNEIYIRQKDGPWPPKLKEYINYLKNKKIHLFYDKNDLMISLITKDTPNTILSESIHNIINEIVQKFGNYSNVKIKINAYRTEPMRYILDQEKKGRKMVNKPILYNNKTIIEIDKDNNSNE